MTATSRIWCRIAATMFAVMAVPGSGPAQAESGSAGTASDSAPAPVHWSLRPVATAAAHTGDLASLAATLDRFIEARRAVAGLEGSPPAARRMLIRRLYLDVHGVPPTSDEIRVFVADDEPGAWDRLVDRVLQSPRYGERWGQHWLDVVRYADTHGFEVNTPRPNAWPYRDWVIRALNDDKPYDRFVVEQLAGDVCGADAATGFLVAGPALLRGQVGKDKASVLQARQDEIDEIVKATGTTFLGLTVGCARCHDHMFDPVAQTDYYAMQAVFAGVHYGERKLPNPEREREAVALVPQIESLRRALNDYEPFAYAGRCFVLDDDAPPQREAGGRGVEVLAKPAGHGVNPKGATRGSRSDLGGPQRVPNLSGGRYSWWGSAQRRDLLAYRAGSAGRFREWLSWGAGFATHTQAARYLLDLDGDLGTRDDQRLLATVDQQRFAAGNDRSEVLPGVPLWSGLLDVGVHDLLADSAIVLRGGPGAATTADVILLQEVTGSAGRGDEKPTPRVVRPRLRRPADSRRTVERFAPLRAKFVRFTSYATNSGHEPCLDELEVYACATVARPEHNVAFASCGATATSSGNYPNSARHKLVHINDGRYGNDHSWISNQKGRGWVQIEFAAATEIDRIEWGRDRTARYADRTATRYTIAVGEDSATDQGIIWRTIASSDDRIPMGLATAQTFAFQYAGLSTERADDARALLTQLERVEATHARLAKGARVFAGTFKTPPPTHRLHRGDPQALREVVVPDAPRVLGTLGLDAGSADQTRRLALADLITEPENPLTARVIVNRIWQHHFGIGIVDTPSDFGRSGSQPSHPLLLDWLASVLTNNRWSLKKVHRVILRSATYRQSDAPRADALARDAGNRLLWRFAPRRLEAEAIRDSILAVSGALDLKMGGPGFALFVPNTNYVRVYEPKTVWTAETWRRMVYAHKVRMERGGVFGAFDCPDAGQAAPKRSRSTTPLQSLNLFNSSFVLQQAGILARRIERASVPDEYVQCAFEFALGRLPTATERRDAMALVGEHGLPALCRVLFNTNEFLVLP